jgi:uncharacterized membrane protein YdjX (TVP38/TMEM64 family)
MPRSQFPYARALILLAVIAALILADFYWGLSDWFQPQRITELLDQTGIWAPLAYMALMACAVIITPIPSLPLDIAAGAFFGVWLGTLYSLLGALIGASVAFGLARYLGRGMVEKLVRGHISFCRQCSNKLLTKVVFLSRLVPFISFDVVSYGAGLTNISFSGFALATLFGMFPLTLAYNYFGATLVLNKWLSMALGGTIVLIFFALPSLIERHDFLGLAKHFRHDSEASCQEE